MRNLNPLFIIALLVFSLASCDKEQPKQLLTSQIEYDVWIEGDALLPSRVNYLAGNERRALLESLFSRLDAGNGISDSIGNSLKANAVYALLQQIDTTVKVGPTSVIALIEKGNLSVKALRFREAWTYNPETLELTKEVKAIAPLLCVMDSANVWKSATPLFWVKTDSIAESEDLQWVPLSDQIQYDAIIDNRIKSVESFYGKCPYYFMNIEEKARVNYLKILVDKVLAREIKAYDYFFALMPEADFQLLKGRKDTLVDIDEASGKTVTSVSDTPLPLEDLARIKFIEKWEFSLQPFAFRKTVYALNPSLVSYDADGEFEGFKPLFWVFFNEEVRNSLVSALGS